MSERPLIFTKLDADRILRRAAEIEGSDDARPLTVDELKAIADEAGFGRQAVERAIAEARQAQTAGVGRPPVQKWGWVVVRLSVFREIPIELSSEELMTVVRLFHPYREGPAQVKLEHGEITWRDRKGIRFALASRGSATELRAFVSKVLLRRGRWTRWVRSASDRLESLIWLVATREDETRKEHPSEAAPTLAAARGSAR